MSNGRVLSIESRLADYERRLEEDMENPFAGPERPKYEGNWREDMRVLLATIRDRDKTIAELQQMCDKQARHWLVEQAENQKLQKQNALMLKALELTLDKLTSGWDTEWDCEPREAGIRVLSEALAKVKGASE